MESIDVKARLTPIMDKLKKLESDQAGVSVDEAKETLRSLGAFSIPVLEELLSIAKSMKQEILTNDIPCLLAEYGLKTCETLDGTKIGIETFYETSQADKDKALLATWLSENGYSHIIKDTLALDKGSFDDRLRAFLAENGYSYSVDSAVNGATLKKTIKELIEAGHDRPPEQAVKVTMFNMAVVKPPKKEGSF